MNIDPQARAGHSLPTSARLALCGVVGMVAVPMMESASVEAPQAIVAHVPDRILAAHGLTPRLASSEKTTQPSSFPKAAETFMNDTTVSMFGNDCSGNALDAGGTAVGVVFSEQCLNINGTTAWQGSNYQQYLISHPIVAEAGASEKELKPLGDITEVVIYRSSHSDVAIGVLDGAAPNKVIDAYQEEHLSEAGIKKLVPGKSKIYMEGWPTNQKKGPNGLISPQKFEMDYIGKAEATEGPLILGGIPKSEKNKDDAFCSYGAIGANGFIVEGNHIEALGTLAAFLDFSKLYGTNKYPDLDKISATENKKAMEDIFPHIDWDKYSGVCGFDNYTTLQEEQTLTDIIPSFEDVPGFGHQPDNVDMATYNAEVAFNNPDVQRLRVLGSAVVTLKNSSGDNEPPIVIRDPLISVGTNGDIMLGEYNYPGVISSIDISGAKALFYQNSPSAPLSTEELSGKFVYPLANTKGALVPGSFVEDSHGEEIGAVEKSTAGLNTSDPYNVSVKNGQLVFEPASNS